MINLESSLHIHKYILTVTKIMKKVTKLSLLDNGETTFKGEKIYFPLLVVVVGND